MKANTKKAKEPKGNLLKRLRANKELLILSTPGAIWFLFFAYLPLFGILVAFKKFRLSGDGFFYNLFTSETVWFDNFKFLFSSGDAWIIVRNTVLYNFTFIILGVAVPVVLALLLNEIKNKGMMKIYQSSMFLPYFLSWVVVSYFVYALLTPERGYINGIITALGGERIMWYQENKYWPFIIVFLNTWKGMGYGMVIYLASITGIDPSLYEAAVMDGATKAQQAKHITLPAIKPVFVMMLILDCGKIFNSDFGLFYQVTGQLPASLYTTASTFDTYIYMAIQSTAPIGQTAAASFFQAICSCGTILLANWIVSKIDNENRII